MPYTKLHETAAVPAGHTAYETGTRTADLESFCNKLISRIVRHLFGGCHFGNQLGCHIHSGEMLHVFTNRTGFHNYA